MPKIKEVYEYNNGSWENGTPIGADASNIDVALSDSASLRDLQTVLGNVSVSDPSIKIQLTGKVDSDSGDIKDTVVSALNPSSATDTSENIDNSDVIVAAGESQYTMWSKFNTFRKRVSNKFNNFLISSVEDVLEPSNTQTYSQAALNNYFADVIGYKTNADITGIGSVADQLTTLTNGTLPKTFARAYTSAAISITSTTANTKLTGLSPVYDDSLFSLTSNGGLSFIKNGLYVLFCMAGFNSLTTGDNVSFTIRRYTSATGSVDWDGAGSNAGGPYTIISYYNMYYTADAGSVLFFGGRNNTASRGVLGYVRVLVFRVAGSS